MRGTQQNCSWHRSQQGFQFWPGHLIVLWFWMSYLTALCWSPHLLNEGNNRTQLSIMRLNWVIPSEGFRMLHAWPRSQSLLYSRHLINTIFSLRHTKNQYWRSRKSTCKEQKPQLTLLPAYVMLLRWLTKETMNELKKNKLCFCENAHKRKVKTNSQTQG